MSRIQYNGENIILYGMGNGGREVLKYLLKEKYPVICAIDKNVQGEIMGIPVVKLDNAECNKGDNCLCVICIVTLSYNDLKKQLEAKGLKNVCHIGSLFIGNKRLYKKYWEINKEDDEDVLQARLLYSGQSLNVYEECIAWYRDAEELTLTEHLPYYQKYLTEEVTSIMENNEVLVDCGASDGDTIMKLTEEMNFSKVYAYEPNTSLYKKLSNLRIDSIDIVKKQIGLGDKEGYFPFVEDRYASKFVEDNSVLKKRFINTIDNEFANKRFDMIKIAGEGYEHRIVKGGGI